MPRNGIIDFHTHPYIHEKNNYCHYADSFKLNAGDIPMHLKAQGICCICGSVVGAVHGWDDVVFLNNQALELKERWKDFYIPGFHIHPDYVENSIAEVQRMANLGVKLVGELVPYNHGWNMGSDGLVPILEEVQRHNMIVSYHSSDVPMVVAESLLSQFPDIKFIAAHPGEKTKVDIHLAIMEKYSNYYLDLSGSGLGRAGLLRYCIDRAGADRFLFGTDFPICPPPMYIATIACDSSLTDDEKDAVFCGNAQRILFGD